MSTSNFATLDPSTGEVIETFYLLHPAQVETVVERADKAFQCFRKLPVHKRAQLFWPSAKP
jgi:acyl-CoA reductase-like NAD-dependent aldehyde dehydrogenase